MQTVLCPFFLSIMTKGFLICDSGSTKSDWLLVNPDGVHIELHTDGINPARDARAIIYNVVHQQLLPQLPPDTELQAVCFYGAGCIEPFSNSVESVLRELLPGCRVEVESDLLGAARALCMHQPGIACILGTGANSCLYDGKRIVMGTPPLGYILGDEGSGSFLGKLLLSDIFKGILPEELRQAFNEKYQLSQADVIEHVYRKPAANTFLASFMPFLAEHRTHPAIRTMLVSAFRLFLTRNVAAYRQPDMPVNCVGGIAYQFTEELSEAVAAEGMIMGKILRRPIEYMAKYHLTE